MDTGGFLSCVAWAGDIMINIYITTYCLTNRTRTRRLCSADPCRRPLYLVSSSETWVCNGWNRVKGYTKMFCFYNLHVLYILLMKNHGWNLAVKACSVYIWGVFFGCFKNVIIQISCLQSLNTIFKGVNIMWIYYSIV